MNDYDSEDKKYQYDDGEEVVDEKPASSKRSQKLSRDIVVDSDEEFDDRDDTGSEPTPRSKSNRDIARFLHDTVYDQNDNISLEDEEHVPSPPSTPVSASNRKKKFGKHWSPTVQTNGDKIIDNEGKYQQSGSPDNMRPISAAEQKRGSQPSVANPSPKREQIEKSYASKSASKTEYVEPVNSTEGCYLLFDPASGGKLTLQYSKTVVNGAIGFWAPGRGKKIQGFKFKQNQGRSDLMKNIAGKDYKKKYFNGWCQFVKSAKMYSGYVCKWSEHERIETDIFVYYNDSCEVKKIEDGELFDVSDIDAVSCLPKGNATFDGVKTGEYGTFLNRGDAVGASTAL
jgi:hypothetical protein